MKVLRVMALIIVGLPLAGCFRPAGEAVQPTSIESIPSQEIGSVDGEVTPASDPLVLASPTLPPITIISPQTRPTQQLGQPLDALQPTATALPPVVEPLGLVTIVTRPSGTPGETPQFITPGVPLGLVTIVVPTATPTAQGGVAPLGFATPTDLFTSQSDSQCIYVVRPGDNLFRIAMENGFTLAEVRAANPDLTGEAPILQPGQEINLPGCADDTAAAVVEPTEASTPAPASPAQTQQVYIVQPGDTLFTIAQRFGVTVRDIVNANNLANPDRLAVGQELIIPAR